MGRASVQIILFFVILNGVGGVITASGLGAAMDINPEIGGDGQVDRLERQADDIKPTGGITDTLFSLYASVGNTVHDMLKFVFYGPYMLVNLGVPDWIVFPFSSILVLIVAADTVHVFTGRDL